MRHPRLIIVVVSLLVIIVEVIGVSSTGDLRPA
jgi:hypothetical protein